MPKAVQEDFRKWGREGGKKRARSLSASRKKAIASHAAKARWGTQDLYPKSVRLNFPRFDDPVYLQEVLEKGQLQEWRRLYHEISEHPFGPTADALRRVLDSTNIYGTTVLWRSILKNLQGG